MNILDMSTPTPSNTLSKMPHATADVRAPLGPPVRVTMLVTATTTIDLAEELGSVVRNWKENMIR